MEDLLRSLYGRCGRIVCDVEYIGVVNCSVCVESVTGQTRDCGV
jgi:hypothetical protein